MRQDASPRPGASKWACGRSSGYTDLVLMEAATSPATAAAPNASGTMVREINPDGRPSGAPP